MSRHNFKDFGLYTFLSERNRRLRSSKNSSLIIFLIKSIEKQEKAIDVERKKVLSLVGNLLLYLGSNVTLDLLGMKRKIKVVHRGLSGTEKGKIFYTAGVSSQAFFVSVTLLWKSWLWAIASLKTAF